MTKKRITLVGLVRHGLASALERAESEWYNYWSEPEEPWQHNTDFPWHGATEQGRARDSPPSVTTQLRSGPESKQRPVSWGLVSLGSVWWERPDWGVVSTRGLRHQWSWWHLQDHCSVLSPATAAADPAGPGSCVQPAGPTEPIGRSYSGARGQQNNKMSHWKSGNKWFAQWVKLYR